MMIQWKILISGRYIYDWEYFAKNGYFAKNIERTHKFKETGDSRCIYQNKLDKACFKCNMNYGSYKYLTWKNYP